MIRIILNIAFDRRAVAAVEFAIIAPVMLGIFGGLADFGLLMNQKSVLANCVAQGAQYAMLIGPSATTTNIQNVVQNAASPNGLTQTVTATVNGPACYCVTGTTLPTTSYSMSASYTCTGTCTGGTWGIYTQIKAQFTYVPLTPFYSKLSATTTVNETIIVKLN